MAQALIAIQSARACLGDPLGISWTDSILISGLQEAFRSMLLSLRVYHIDVIKNQTSVMLVPALTTILSTVSGYPTNMVNPISMMERIPGTDNDSFIDMIQTDFVPVIDQTQDLNFWSWLGEQILLVGAIQNKEVLLRYEGTLTVPSKLTDNLGFIMAENYLGPKIAAICLNAISKDGSKWDARAETALYDVIRSNVVEDQRPTRRRGYRSSKSKLTSGNVRTV